MKKCIAIAGITLLLMSNFDSYAAFKKKPPEAELTKAEQQIAKIEAKIAETEKQIKEVKEKQIPFRKECKGIPKYQYPFKKCGQELIKLEAQEQVLKAGLGIQKAILKAKKIAKEVGPAVKEVGGQVVEILVE